MRIGHRATTISAILGKPIPAVIVAAHQDDEVIGAALPLVELPEASVVHVTNGAPRDPKYAHQAGFADSAEYASVRSREAQAALALIGRHQTLVNLGVPAHDVAQDFVRLARCLAQLFSERMAEVVITHAYEGGHPDHDASAFLTHAAAELIRRAGGSGPVVVEMTGYHGFGGDFVVGEFLAHADAGPVESFQLNDDARRLKSAMMDCYKSQPMAGWPRGQENFRAAPRYDFGAPPHPGLLLHERSEWGMPGEEWRRLACDAARVLGVSHIALRPRR